MLKLTTGDLWDEELHRPVDNGCHPELEDDVTRRSRAYIEKFRERIPLGRAIRLKCGACMGGDNEAMPRGEVARAVDECGSVMCPLWPFRYGRDPWRPELTDEQLEVKRALAARSFRPLGQDRANSRRNASD